jgi:hypothetical protein
VVRALPDGGHMTGDHDSLPSGCHRAECGRSALSRMCCARHRLPIVGKPRVSANDETRVKARARLCHRRM